MSIEQRLLSYIYKLKYKIVYFFYFYFYFFFFAILWVYLLVCLFVLLLYVCFFVCVLVCLWVCDFVRFFFFSTRLLLIIQLASNLERPLHFFRLHNKSSLEARKPRGRFEAHLQHRGR